MAEARETAGPQNLPSPIAGATGFVCMIAYTLYANDARVRREAETLASHGFHVRCLTTRSGAGPAQYVLNGVEVKEFQVPKYRGKSTLAYLVSYVLFMLASAGECLRLLVKRELDVVHVHNLPDFLVFAGLVPRMMGRRVVLDVHDSVPETFATKFFRAPLLWQVLCFEERLSAFVAHKVICVNQPQRETLVARGIPMSKTFVSMNVPDPRIFNQSLSVEQLEATDGSFDLVYHGTMATRLGVDLVIRAVASLQHKVPNVRLNLWGSGDDLDEFRRLARELKVEDKVLFKPEGYPLEELPDQLLAMHVGVVGNRRSASGDLMLPVKLLEYVCLGIPAVVPKLRTIQHYFLDDMVSYYEPEDIESLAEAVCRLYCQPDLRRRQAQRARTFLTEQGWERKGAELVALYQTLMES